MSLTTRLLRRLPLRDNHGISLVELLVGILLSVIVATSAMGILISGLKITVKTNKQNDVTGELTVALDSMTQTLQTSTRETPDHYTLVPEWIKIRSGTPSHPQLAASSGVEATFHAYKKQYGMVIIHWYVNKNRELAEEVTACAPKCWDGGLNLEPVEKRVLLKNVVVPRSGQKPIFSWFNTRDSKPLNSSDPYERLSTVGGVVGVYVSLTTYDYNPRHQPATVENFSFFRDELAAFKGKTEWTNPPLPSGQPVIQSPISSNSPLSTPVITEDTRYWMPETGPGSTYTPWQPPVPPHPSQAAPIPGMA